jgi:hypothetical protein
MGREKKEKEKSRESLADWKEVLNSVYELSEIENEEKLKYIFDILYVLIKFVIDLIENGMEFPEERIKEMFGMNGPKACEAYFS